MVAIALGLWRGLRSHVALDSRGVVHVQPRLRSRPFEHPGLDAYVRARRGGLPVGASGCDQGLEDQVVKRGVKPRLKIAQPVASST